MAKSRKDNKGRVLFKGESQRKTKPEYVYTYRDAFGNRRFVYACTLKELREKEDQLKRDSLDGIDMYLAKKASINYVFDRYMSRKVGLRETTRSTYEYMYDHYVRNGFGKRNLAEVKFSDVKYFYLYLLNEKKFGVKTVGTIHSLLHATFEMAIRDDIVRKNPTLGVLPEIRKELGINKGVRHALTLEQQRAFMKYIEDTPAYFKWWTIFTVFLGTGCRAGELIGLRWEDLDFDKGLIDINHSVVYHLKGTTLKNAEFQISLPKTEAGIRKIPMTQKVRTAFEMEYEERKKDGFNSCVIDGMTGFVFLNKYGHVFNPQTINGAIRRIVHQYNADELIKAKREKREPIIIPNFSCHHLRHTFCSRLCENETNLKVIQSIMGHASIKTTMDIYAECADSKKIEAIEKLSMTLDVF